VRTLAQGCEFASKADFATQNVTQGAADVASRTLTPVSIENLKPGTIRQEIADAKATGLYLIIQPTGRRRFCVRYRFQGASRKLTLAPGLSLAEARRAAANAMCELEKGIDPAVAKQTAKLKAALAHKDTLAAVCVEYFKRPEHKKLRSIGERERVLARLVYPILGDRVIGDIKRSELVRLFDRIEDNSGSVMADHVLAYVRRIMNWHASRSDEFRSPIVRGMARTKPKERARSRILTDDELRRVWLTAEASNGPFSCLIRFLLLTAARRTEAAALTWDELENGDWVLPAVRNKSKVDLVRPLAPATQALLTAQPKIEGCKFVFSLDGRRRMVGFGRAKKRFDAACGVTGWVLHDLRRTARSLLSRAGISADHAERCLGHALVGVRGTYDRHEFFNEKKLAFEALASLIERIVHPKDNVQALRG
jgi:integrase